MKHFLLFLGILTVAVAAQAKKNPRHAEADGIWKPGTASIYYWDSETNDWGFYRTVNYSHNDFGQLTKYESDGNTQIFEYTPTGQISSITITSDGEISKTSYTYDEVTGEQTGYTNCIREDDQWVTIGSERCSFTRDEKGNITHCMYSSSVLEQAGHYVYKYGDDDKINEIIYYLIQNGDRNVDAHLKDIVWENTDNQPIFKQYYDNYYITMFPVNLCIGDNRIKSCTIDDYFGKGTTADMNVEYTDNLGSFKGQISVYGTPIRIYECSVLDENGSYAAYIENTEYSVNGSTITTGDVDFYKEVYKYDSYGHPIESGFETERPDYKYKTTYDVTYDPTYGYPTEAIYMSATNDEEMQTDTRIVYGDYALYAGAVSPEADAYAPAEYYNPECMSKPPYNKWHYIRHQGKSISKTMVK